MLPTRSETCSIDQRLDLLNQSAYLQSKCLLSKPLASKCFPNLWPPNVFQNTSKCFSKRSERQSNGEFASKGFAKTSKFRSVQNEREILPSLALRKVIPKLSKYCSCERIRSFLQADGLLRRIIAIWFTTRLKACCIEGERPCGAIGRSRLAWGQSLTLLFRDSFRGLASAEKV